VKCLDRPRLKDVERFTGGDRAVIVDEDDVSHRIDSGKRASDGAAQFSGS
jgi:hypothetical protein